MLQGREREGGGGEKRRRNPNERGEKIVLRLVGCGESAVVY